MGKKMEKIKKRMKFLKFSLWKNLSFFFSENFLMKIFKVFFLILGLILFIFFKWKELSLT